MHILWIILVGFVAGIIARNLLPGPNNPSGFILTTVIGIAGAYRSDHWRCARALRLASAGGDAHRHRSDDSRSARASALALSDAPRSERR